MSDAYNQMHIKQPKLEAFVLLWFRQSLILYEVLKDRKNQTDSANALHVFICRKFAEIIPQQLNCLKRIIFHYNSEDICITVFDFMKWLIILVFINW